MSRLISQFFYNLNSSKYFTYPSGKLRIEFASPIAKSTSPGLLDTTFFARWTSHEPRQIPASNPGLKANIMKAVSVLGSLPCSERFFSGYPGLILPCPQKPTLPNSHSIWNARTHNRFLRSPKWLVGKQITTTVTGWQCINTSFQYLCDNRIKFSNDWRQKVLHVQ